MSLLFFGPAVRLDPESFVPVYSRDYEVLVCVMESCPYFMKSQSRTRRVQGNTVPVNYCSYCGGRCELQPRQSSVAFDLRTAVGRAFPGCYSVVSYKSSYYVFPKEAEVPLEDLPLLRPLSAIVLQDELTRFTVAHQALLSWLIIFMTEDSPPVVDFFFFADGACGDE